MLCWFVGAVGLGAGRLGCTPPVARSGCATGTLAGLQSLLMHAYEKLFRGHDVAIAQVLLTEDDFHRVEALYQPRRTMENCLNLAC